VSGVPRTRLGGNAHATPLGKRSRAVAQPRRSLHLAVTCQQRRRYWCPDSDCSDLIARLACSRHPSGITESSNCAYALWLSAADS
jgi:hypothetical protein